MVRPLIFILLFTFTSYSQNWFPLGSGMNNQVMALTVFNGELIAGGNFTNAGGIPANSIAKWNGTAWSPLGLGIIGDVRALTVYNNELIAGGHFFTAGGIDANCIAKWNGTSWSPLGSGMNYYVTSLTVHANELVAGGAFTIAGGSPASAVAHWNGSSWGPYASGLPNIVNCVAGVNDTLFVGGNFYQTYRNTGKWVFTGWTAIGNSGCNGEVKSMLKSGNDLIIGGLFSAGGSVVANRIIKWTGSQFTAMGSGMNNYINCLAATDSFIIAGGTFTTAGGLPSNRISKWRTNWQAMGDGFNDEVFAITVFGNDIIAGGMFTQSGSTAINYIGRYSQVTGINIINSKIPEKFGLNQNYPNPFNPSTKISFDITEKGILHLNIYDVSGKQVSILVNKEMDPGTYEVVWDGSGFASGVYYCRLIQGSNSLIKKMIYLK